MEALLFILFIVLAIAGNKGKAEAKKRRQQARREPPAYTPPPTVGDALPGAAFDWQAEGTAYEAVPVSGSLTYDSPEGPGARGGIDSVFREGMPDSQEGQDPLSPSTHLTSITHIVRPFTEGDHSHTESSLTGGFSCPPVSGFPSGSPPRAAHRQAAAGLHLDLAGVRQGIIYAEILGKPRALQGRARR